MDLLWCFVSQVLPGSSIESRGDGTQEEGDVEVDYAYLLYLGVLRMHNIRQRVDRG